MKNATRKIMLLALAVLLLAVFAGCNGEGTEPAVSADCPQINTVEILPNAYLNEAFDLREILIMEDGVEYSATAFYVTAIFDEATNTFSNVEHLLEVKDLSYTPVEVSNTVVTITATRGQVKSSKAVVIPTVIRADPLDDLLKSDGTYGVADGGITKNVNNDPAFIQGENSATSLHVSFNSMDPHPWGNTFASLNSEEVQKHFTDQTWKNAILTFWVYNPNEKAIEFQLRLADDITKLNVDWNNADGPHKQIAEPGRWTQIFFPLRKLGVQNRITEDKYHSCAVNLKFRYEDYSTTESYSFDFYLDNLDVVDGSVYPEIDNSYVLSDETLEQGWENMAQDIGWQGTYTEYNYENIQGEDSECSLKAYFNNDKALSNSFICLAPEMDERIAELPDMTGGILSAYFKFENMDARVSLDIVNKSWASSNEVDFKLTSVGDGWYYGEVNMEDIQVGTGLNDNIIRIRLKFHGVSKNSVAYVDTCKFEYKKVNKVLESVSADWINMSPDKGPFYYVGNASFVTSHLQGGNSVRSLKLVAPSGSNGKYTIDTLTAANSGEISNIPNMNKGTLGAWFYFGDQAPSAYVALTNDLYYGSNGVDFVFTKNAGNGWYYGELHGSDFTCAEGGGTSKIIRISILIPSGYTVYIDNLHWNAGVEEELVAVETPKPVAPSYTLVGGEDMEIPLNNTKPLSSLSFEYKIESGEKFAIALMPNWDSYYGYYNFCSTGMVDEDSGVTAEMLEDGYIRVTMDMAALTKRNGDANATISFLYIRGVFSDANGTIRNITLVEGESTEDPDIELPGNIFQGGNDLIIELDNADKLAAISFDYKIISGEKFAIALMPNWDAYYGYYNFNGIGSVDSDSGITTEELEDGYIRVTMDIAELTKTNGNVNEVITFLYVRGAFTNANGTIHNIVLIVDDGNQEPTEPTEPTEPDVTEPTEPEVTEPTEPENVSYPLISGMDLTIPVANEKEVVSLSFDYKIESGEKFAIALMPNWDAYYGYYNFNSNGNVDNDTGITTKTLDNGYIRVIFDMASLTKTNGNVNTVITFLYVRGAFTDANGIIENVTVSYEAIEPEPSEPEITEPETTEPEVTEPEITEPEVQEHTLVPGEDLIIPLDVLQNLKTLSLEYKVSCTFNMALVMEDWGAYYGYFAFDENGNVDPYDGITLETLEDGYIRVTFDVAALTKYVGTPNSGFNTLYIRGDWSDAQGVLRNITLKGEIEEPFQPENVQYDVAAGADLIVDLETIENLTALSFEYKVAGTFNMALVMEDWNAYYGYFAFNENGNVDPYDGITLETLEDGYTRVTFNIAALTKMVGTPNSNFNIFFIRGNWTDANGIIRNITLASNEEETPDKVLEGTNLAAGADRTILTDCTAPLTYITFDYKITAGESFNIALMPNWDSYFGYFAFDANGNIDPYDGISCETLENGYIRVTIDMAKLTKYSGSPVKVIEFLYVRGNWTNATGEITNICLYWNAIEEPLSNPLTLRENRFLVSSKRLFEELLEEETPDND